MTSKAHILLVEDDPNFGLVMSDYLRMNNYQVDLAPNGNIGYNLLMKNTYDLCILDVMMPEMDGFSLAEEMRRKRTNTPFFFLTAKSLKNDIVRGYELGAVDYLNKPFDPEILLLKIRSILGRKAVEEVTTKAVYEFLGYQLDVKRRRLISRNEETSLSPKECRLLAYLLEHQNELVQREQVLNALWEESNYFTARSMDVYINKLRNRFRENPNVELENQRGEGFVLVLKD